MFRDRAEHRDVGGDEFSEIGDEKSKAHPSSKSSARRNTRMTREPEILINNSGIRAINRQCLIFKTLEGWSQLRWKTGG